jgi:hypothetical protein
VFLIPQALLLTLAVRSVAPVTKTMAMSAV